MTAFDAEACPRGGPIHLRGPDVGEGKEKEHAEESREHGGPNAGRRTSRVALLARKQCGTVNSQSSTANK